jgi:hypothetical protein
MVLQAVPSLPWAARAAKPALRLIVGIDITSKIAVGVTDIHRVTLAADSRELARYREALHR